APFLTRAPSAARSATTVAGSAARISPPGGGSSVPSLEIGTRRSRRAAAAVGTGGEDGRRNATAASKRARTPATAAIHHRESGRGPGSFIGYGSFRSGLPAVDLLFRRRRLPLVVVEPRVVEHFLTHQDPQRVGQLQVLDEEVVLGLEIHARHRRFEVEGEPLLDAREPCALREVEEEDQVQGDRGRQDRVAAEKVDLDLHGLAEPSHNVYIVP